MKDREKWGKEVPIYRHEPNNLDRQTTLDAKLRVKIKSIDRTWAFKRHSKEFKTNDQDGGAAIEKRGTQALKALFMGKHIASPCAAYSRKPK